MHNYSCYLTWSPRLRPASYALDPLSTLVTNIPQPLSKPPRIEKCMISSLVALVSVTVLGRALAAQAMFSSLSCPPILCNNTQVSPGKVSQQQVLTQP